MKNIIRAIRAIPKKGQSNITKIVSLSIGLAVGLVLISKVFFEQSYDNFYPDADRVYQIQTRVKTANDPAKDFSQVSGAVAPGIKAESPRVETATRYTYISGEGTFTHINNKNRYQTGAAIIADSCFFDILPRPMIMGNAKEVLSRPMHALVAKSIAEKIGGDVIGQTFQLDTYPDRILTIGGVFEDIPDNSHKRYDIIISMNSIGKFTWDGRTNWIGNDRYLGYVKLLPETNMQEVAKSIRQMQEKNQSLDELAKMNTDLSYYLLPLNVLHSDTPSAKRSTILLSILAVILILVSVMNYILIVVSSLVGRSKEIAVHKCYGAGKRDISKLVFSEIFVHLIISIIIALGLILISRKIIEDTLGTSLQSLFNLQTCLLLVGVCTIIFICTALIPSHLFAKIPVASAIKNFNVSKQIWRLGLLFVQIVSVFFLACLLLIVEKQYDAMINDKPGYSHDKVLYCNLAGVSLIDREKMVELLKNQSCVEEVAGSYTLPFGGFSGNLVSKEEGAEELFNFADFYRVSYNYLSLMQIPIIEGDNFSTKSSTSDMLISEKFAKRLALLLGWTDGAIGKSVFVSEHGNVTIRGIFQDFRLGSITTPDNRPLAITFSKQIPSILSIRLNTMSTENIAIVNNVIKEALPNHEIHPQIFSNEIVQLYQDARRFGNSVLIGGIVTLLIGLIGLIGYLRNEVVRRGKEIAIRRVSGASLAEIIVLFLKDILILCIPAVIIGEIGAIITSNKWMEDFALKYEASSFLLIGCAISMIAIILGVVAFYCSRIANTNPVETLQNE